MEHIAPIIARITAKMAAEQAKHTNHGLRCPFWDRIDPRACSCETRPLIDLLLHIAARNAA